MLFRYGGLHLAFGFVAVIAGVGDAQAVAYAMNMSIHGEGG